MVNPKMRITLYNVLKIDNKANPEMIRAAYEARLGELRNAVDHESQNELKLAQQAFAILGNPAKKTAYDDSLSLEQYQGRITNAVDHSLNYKNSVSTLKTLVWVVASLICAILFFGFKSYLLDHHSRKALAASIPAPSEQPLNLTGTGQTVSQTVAAQQDEAMRRIEQVQRSKEQQRQEAAAQEEKNRELAAVAVKKEELRKEQERLSLMDGFINARDFDKARALAKTQDEYDYVNLKEQMDIRARN